MIVDNNAVGKNYHDHFGVAVPAKLKRKLNFELVGSGFVGHVSLFFKKYSIFQYFHTSSWNKKNAPNNGPDFQAICTSLPHLASPSAASLALKAIFSKNSYPAKNTLIGKFWRLVHRFFVRIIPRTALSDIYYLGIVNNQPHSRGTLKLRSRNPFDDPLIDPQVHKLLHKVIARWEPLLKILRE